MNKLSGIKIWSGYSAAEWTLVKIPVGIFWLLTIKFTSVDPDTIPYPCGIFSVINGSFLASKYTVPVFFILAFVLVILYISEKWMTATTFLMFLLSLVLFTLEESGGIANRNCLYTMIFFVQFIAYYRKSPHLKEERIQFAIQIIAAGYMLAGFSKLKQAGLHWVTDSPLVSIQVLKGYSNAYFNTGDIKQFHLGLKNAGFILEHPLLIKTFFAGSLLLELCAFIAVKNKFTAFIYGLLLTAMHIGIFYFMNILIMAIFLPMFLFMINPLYLMYLAFRKLFVLIRFRVPSVKRVV